jgi:hypothetical protein
MHDRKTARAVIKTDERFEEYNGDEYQSRVP